MAFDKKAYAKKYYAENKEKIKAAANKYYAENKEKIAAQNKEYYAENKEVIAASNKKYRAENKEKIAAKDKKWYLENKERINIKRKKGYEKNKEKELLVCKEWRDNHPDYQLSYQRANKDKMAEYSNRRRASKVGNGVFTIAQKFMRNLYNSPCVSCGASENITADHIIPIIKGGRHSEGNLQPLCGSCNSSKNSKLQIEFIAEKKGS
jgi:5-methylcytosine-specific restriction endonuclease McrA